MTMSLTMNGVIGGGSLLGRRVVVVVGGGKIALPSNSNRRHVDAGVRMTMKGGSASFIAPSIVARNSQHASTGAAASALVTTRMRLIASQRNDIAPRRSLDDTIASTVVCCDDDYKGNVVDGGAAAELDKRNVQQFTKAAEKRGNQQQQPSARNYNNDYHPVHLLQSITSPLATCIGSITTNPIRRRLRRHNGSPLSTGAAARCTKTAGRRTISNNNKSIPRLGSRVPARRRGTIWALNAVAETSDVQYDDSFEGHYTNSDIMTKEEEEEDVVVAVVGNTVTIPAKFKPYPFPYHTELIVRIESLTNLGFGIARVELDDYDNEQRKKKEDNSGKNENNEGHYEVATNEKKKWVIFVPNVIPDELVKVRIYRNFASYSDADLLQIIEPSLDRIQPICSLATVCGGCQYQHISITKQRQMKTLQVQELFEKLGGISPKDFPTVLDTIGTDEIYGYRSKITPHYDAPLKKKSQPRECTIGPIGFKEKASHRIVDVPYCHIATSTINYALHTIRDSAREQARLGLLKKPTKGATLLLRDSNNGGGVVETNHTAYVNTTVNNLTFRFQAGNFFQNNPYMLPIMADLVVNAATRVSRTTGQTMTHLIDCYCGSGLFCIASSSKFNVCVGIEVNEKAIEEARDNALLNGIHNCDFVAASAEAIFMSKEPVRIAGDGGGGELLVADFPRERTVVVLDPPRKGCSEEFMAQLNDFRPVRVVYMSCDPSTQARDAKLLLSYGYEIVSIQPFDLFPQTRHIECLAVFEKKL